MEWKQQFEQHIKAYIEDNVLSACVSQINILFIIRDCVHFNSVGT